MTRPITQTRAALAGLGVALALLASSAASAEGEADEAVYKVLRDRTATFCNAVLPAWFASKRGIHEPGFRAIVVDCYLGQARLAVLGTNSDIALEDTALPELPARLLGAATGMNLDIYRPLAGRTVINRMVPK
jgi:hypothetical protein